MQERAADIIELLGQIESAFADSIYPGAGRIVYDESGYHLECNEVAAQFTGKHWKDVPFEALRHASLYAFTPEAYRYYLPAYLNAVLRRYDEADVLPESTVFSLTTPSDGRWLPAHRDRMSGFTNRQLNAIMAFLDFLKAHYPGDDPLGDIDKAQRSVAEIAAYRNP